MLFPEKSNEERVLEWLRGPVTTPPFMPDPAYDEAMRRRSGAPDFTKLVGLLGQLRQTARPRPDLITPGSTGKLENARPVTFAGRVSLGGETPAQIMSRFPHAELETGSIAMESPALLAGLAPIRSALQKKIAKAAYRGSPELMKEVIEAPRTVSLGQGSLGEFYPKEAASLSASGFYMPSGKQYGSVFIDPNVMRGKVPESALEKAFRKRAPELSRPVQTGRRDSSGNLVKASTHEVQHSRNRDIIHARYDKYEQLEPAAREISQVLTGEGKRRVDALLRDGAAFEALDEAMSYLREQAIGKGKGSPEGLAVARFLNTGSSK